MKKNNWDLGKDEEELLEFSLHKTQYIDYKNGEAKKKLINDISSKKQSEVLVKESVSENKKEIITIDDINYEVEYSINNEIDFDSKEDSVKGNKILSPIEGRVFLAKDPKEKSIKVGDSVNKGDVICYIESMKVINAIKSEFSGEVIKICFKDGDDIYDDDILFIIK